MIKLTLHGKILKVCGMVVPYSQKTWWELNYGVELKLAD